MRGPIFITGCARSGTSMTAGIIERCGAYGGKTIMGSCRANRKGFFENSEIREKIVKPYLILNGADPLGQFPLPDIDNLNPLNGLKEKVESIYMHQGYEYGPWYYKGAKLCLIWKIWHKAFPTAKWVIVRRDDEDTAYSCLRTGFMKAYKTAEGWQKWIDTHKKRFEEMKAAGLNIQEVHPSKFVEGDYSEIKTTIENLGLKWREDSVKDFVSPKLWRGKDGK